jgi:YidC/Oxa1 family membrane protein insertase
MLQREMTALYQAEGTSMFAGCLPLLLQWPAFTVLSLLFRSAQVGGAPNTLLTHRLFGAPLASYWLGGAGPFSAQGAVFAGLFVLLAGLGWLSARMARRAGSPPAVTGAAAGEGVPAALVRLLPFATVAIAVFVPLAAALYLATSTAWTLAERAVFGRSPALRPPTTPAVPRTGPRSLRDTRPPPGGRPSTHRLGPAPPQAGRTTTG